MPSDRFRWSDDDPEELALDWDTYEAEMWLRDAESGRWKMTGYADWDAVMAAMERRQRARLAYRRALADGVCLEGAYGIGPYETVEHNGRYL